MRKIALVMDGWKRWFTFAWPAGILQRIHETEDDVNLYIFNSSGNWSKNAGYNRAEYNIFNLPDFTDFDGIILELNNISEKDIHAEVSRRARESEVPVVSIGNKLEDFYYVGIDNYGAMYQMMSHLHEKHDCKRFWLLMGPRDNYESNRRLEGLLDYAKEHGITVSEDEIQYGAFDFRSGMEEFHRLWEKHKKLPEAVICVNDNIAVAVCEAAAELGFTVPEDFKVTGFDNFDKACFYTPSIATVSYIREESGYAAAALLQRIWAGEELPRYNYTTTEILWQESCGCGKGTRTGGRDARTHLKDQIIYGVDSEEFDEEVLALEAAMMQCETVEEMMYCIPQHIPSLKCDGMYLVLDDHINDYKRKAEKSIHLEAEPSNEGFCRQGYPKKMPVAFAYEQNHKLDLSGEGIESIFPMFDCAESGQDFLFLPLHFGEYTIGYVAIRNAVYLMEKQYLFQIMNVLTRSMESLHKKEMLAYMNRRLSSLYITDTLTGLYNRMGYQQLGKKLLDGAREQNKRLLILFADLDGLKYINDTYGHEYGDMAIRVAARALLQCCGRDAIAARTGGDEFVVLQVFESEEATRELLLSLRSTLEEEGKAQKLPFSLSMSVGTVVTDPTSALSFAEYVRLADTEMYSEKTKKHAGRR